MNDNKLIEIFGPIIEEALTSSKPFKKAFGKRINQSWDEARAQESIINEIIGKVFMDRVL